MCVCVAGVVYRRWKLLVSAEVFVGLVYFFSLFFGGFEGSEMADEGLSSGVRKARPLDKLDEMDLMSAGSSRSAEGEGDCALCRRCQMRKRLEKKRRERSLQGMVPAVEEVVEDASMVEDLRSIDDWLSYINGRSCEKVETVNLNTKSKKRKNRKKVAGTVEGALEKAVGKRSSDAPTASSENQREQNRHRDSLPKAEDDEGSTYFIGWQQIIHPVPSNNANMETDCPELTMEQQLALDREVEEFRRRLEDVSLPEGGRIKPALQCPLLL